MGHDGRGWASRFSLFLLPALALAAACAGSSALAPLAVAAPGSAPDTRIAWHGPLDRSDRAALAGWRSAVGPPVAPPAGSIVSARADAITVVSWNTAVGRGDILRAIGRMRRDGRPIVLLLQDVFRKGPAVPVDLPRGALVARGTGSENRAARDIESVARAAGLFLYYVPSMRNGGLPSDEDRGNAILSSVPLDDLAAIELPFERQRRVAVAATVSGITTAGDRWRVRLVNVHLDNRAGAKRGWIGSEFARARQAAGLRALVSGGEPMVVGGDLNTWFGTRDAAYHELAPLFDELDGYDGRATFGPLRLDHVLVRMKPGWRASVARAEDRFGSDHFPLIGTLSFR